MNPKILSTINEHVVNQLEAIGVEYKDILNNGRPAISIFGGEKHRSALDKTQLNYNNSPHIINKKLSKFGISVIEDKNNYKVKGSLFYNCRDWAFDKLKIKKGFDSATDQATNLTKSNSEELKWVSTPILNSLALYFNPAKPNESVGGIHWGIVTQVNEQLIIQSKWSSSHVYEHLLFSVPKTYGNTVMFFDKVNK